MTKYGRRLEEPREPSKESSKCNTAYHPQYRADLHANVQRPPLEGREYVQSMFAGLPLFTEDHTHCPMGCLLIDRAVARLIDLGNPPSVLSSNFPVEFDTNGMVKVRRMPKGYAAKIWVKKGDIDRNGVAASVEGYYHAWVRGLNLLCGLDGQDQYLYRPVHEILLENQWYFDVQFFAKLQEEEGGPLATAQLQEVIGSKAPDIVKTQAPPGIASPLSFDNP